ncbi:MAG: DUF4878 domain-containing protein [Planctomycetia bacterium]|nr:DUF4878 domain-containing protein [Planctomycetia bacterium]
MRQRSVERSVGLRGVAVFVLMSLLYIPGCGDGPVDQLDTSTETGAINLVLTKLVDAAGSQRLTEELWVKSSIPKPADRAKFRNYNGFIATETLVEGDTAKVKVEVYGKDGTVVSTQDWVMSKADGTWRVQSAPLPAK